MKIQIKSDLHNEFSWHKTRPYREGVVPADQYINPDADVIVLAGDIVGPTCEDAILAHYGNCGKPIVYVTGNHEAYGDTHQKTIARLKAKFEGTNIHLLNPGYLIIQGVLFVGATMWTELPDNAITKLELSRWSDCQWIKDMTFEHWNKLHATDKNVMYQSLSFAQFKELPKVMVTHMLPSNESVPFQYKGVAQNMFFVDPSCEEIMKEDYAPELWIHGHTHTSCDYQLHKTRVVCNPYGYWPNMLNKEFKPDLLVEINNNPKADPEPIITQEC
jgi:predicted phosphodiesterase